MGMGKTISTLALLLSDNPKDPRPPSLIVAPTSLVAQWESELACKVDPGRGLAVVRSPGALSRSPTDSAPPRARSSCTTARSATPMRC
jgi:hypothetical protein